MTYNSENGFNGRPEDYTTGVMLIPYWVAKALRNNNIPVEDWTDITKIINHISISDLSDIIAIGKAISYFGVPTNTYIGAYNKYFENLTDNEKQAFDSAVIQGECAGTINSIKEQLNSEYEVNGQLYEILITKKQEVVIVINKGFNYSFSDREFTKGFLSEYIKATIMLDNKYVNSFLKNIYNFYINNLFTSVVDIVQ